MPAERFYLTTPIYYVNSRPHIGHAYTSIAADTLARYHRLTGKKVLYLTGTDEHGQKVAKAAQEAGMTPKEFTDKISMTFRELWSEFGLTNDDFIRTTEERHIQGVQKFWTQLDERGQIYKAAYTGWYCTPCETFFTQRQVLEQDQKLLCPDCKRPVEKLDEENYFLKTSLYQQWLREYIQNHPGFIMPEIRRNEVMGFLDNNVLQDLCISRPKSRLSWGICSPLSEDHVTYVWFDALINYITACGFGQDPKLFDTWWPADVHLVGKDILRHHAIYWPIMLKAAGLEIPRRIFAHGWWVQGGQKMSKSLGNVVDPLAVARKYGLDTFRYFLLREVPFGSDGSFSEEALVDRFNHDLANDLGNLLHRSLTMCEKYFDSQIPAGSSLNYRGNLRQSVDELAKDLEGPMERLAFSEALERIWVTINTANKSIEEAAPWKLSKDNRTDELKRVIVGLLEVLKATAQAVSPFMPQTADGIWKQLGLTPPMDAVEFRSPMWGFFEKGDRVVKGSPLFPRIEKKSDKR